MAAKEMLLVGSKVKAYIKSKKFHTAGDFLEGLNEEVHVLINKACARTEANGRSTVRKTDN